MILRIIERLPPAALSCDGMYTAGFYVMKKHTNDFEHDAIPQLVLRLAIPTMLAQLVSVLYSIVDRMYIGVGVGDLALAGVGVCSADRDAALFLCLTRRPRRLADHGHADGRR